jgi:hypothetical protein
MASLEVPNKYLALAPIIVTAPAARCGTTLVQRLLTASANGFIFGEEIGNQLRVLTNWMVGQMQYVERMGPSMDAEFASTLAGEHAAWRPGLMPPAQVLLKAWIETYYQVPFTLADHAASVGRPMWGYKYPAYSRDNLRAMLSLMPRAKVVYVFRSLYEALKSAKARRFVNTPQETVEFCGQWATNMSEVSELASDQRVLFLKYEDFVERREEHTRLLELFTGVAGMDPAVFEAKINTFRGAEAEGMAADGYIAPADLSAADRAVVVDKAGPVMQRLYGDAA